MTNAEKLTAAQQAVANTVANIEDTLRSIVRKSYGQKRFSLDAAERDDLMQLLTYHAHWKTAGEIFLAAPDA